ncbi:hypothetical protein Hanom_Chr14g01303031 [Helianthus anomalus]
MMCVHTMKMKMSMLSKICIKGKNIQLYMIYVVQPICVINPDNNHIRVFLVNFVVGFALR